MYDSTDYIFQMENDEEFTNKKSRFNPIPVDYPILTTFFFAQVCLQHPPIASISRLTWFPKIPWLYGRDIEVVEGT